MKRREFIAATWRCGGDAVHRAGATGRARAAHRRSHSLTRTTRKCRSGSRLSCKGCSNWAGPKAAMYRSITAGRWQRRDNSQIFGRISCACAGRYLGHGLLHVGPLLQATRTVPIVFGSCPIQSAPVLSIVWRGPVATPRDLFRLNTASAENGWNCSRRLHRT